MEYNYEWQNNGKTKICIGLGTRPEIIRLAAVIKRCREYFDTCIIYYNQNWDKNLSTVFWEDFELKNNKGEFGPDILVPVVGENLGVTCGNILGRSYELLTELQPDAYLVLGDTNSCLSAISGKSACTFRCSIWKRAIDARTNAYPRKQTAESLTSFPM